MKLSVGLKRIVLLETILPITLLILGIYNGLLQVLYRAGMIQSTNFLGLEYYQGLTIHGVVNALVLTTFFAVAYGHVVISKSLKTQLNEGLAWSSAILMIAGTLMAAWAMLMGKASVLYTFYPPLKAHPLFYLGAALLIVGSWLAYLSWVLAYVKWRKDNPTTKMPLAVLGTIVNFTIWFVCTLAVAYEVLVMLLPWSLGWTQTVNVTLARTLFWFFGHALVYFWLLPAYIMYYTVLPKVAGGKLYSDLAGRLVFFLFLIFSIPIGVHHQFADAGITRSVKFFQSVLTFGVAIPSMLTAFTIAASLEYAGRKRGATGLFGWMRKLPFFNSDNYLFAYLISGLVMFIFGGLTGIVNASYNLNNVVHNTAWMPGHFHMTVGGPVFLAILGMSMYIITNLLGKEQKFKNLNVVVPYMWMIGVFLFSSGLMWGGLIGEPRRTNMGMTYLNPESPLFNPYWVYTTTLTVIGGVIMTVSCIFYFIVFFGTVFSKTVKEGDINLPETEAYHDEPRVAFLDSFKPWVVIMLLLILLAYVPALLNVFKYTGPGALPHDPSSPVPLELYDAGK